MAKSKAITHGYECAVKVGSTSLICYSAGLRAAHSWQHFGDDEAMTGTEFPRNERRILSQTNVSGSLLFRPTAAEAAALLQTFFTGSTSAGAGDWTGYTYYDMTSNLSVDLTATTPAGSQTVIVDRAREQYTYDNVVVNGFTLRAAQNSAAEVELDCLGHTETAGTADAGSATAGTPLMGYHATLTIGGNEYFPNDWEITCSRNFTERFHNSVSRSQVQAGKFSGQLSMTIDWNADTVADLWALAGTNTPIAGRLILSDGTSHVGLDIAEMVCPDAIPETGGEGEFTPSISFDLNYDGTNPIVRGYADIN